MKNKKDFYQVALASLLITWNIFTIEQAISTSDNDQVKAAGKDYVNVKPELPEFVCFVVMLQKKKAKDKFLLHIAGAVTHYCEI